MLLIYLALMWLAIAPAIGVPPSTGWYWIGLALVTVGGGRLLAKI